EVYYRIEVPEAMKETVYVVFYEIDDTFTGRYISGGIYLTDDIEFPFPQPVRIGENHENIDLEIVKGNVISGTINIPQPAPEGGEEIMIYATHESANGGQLIEFVEMIPEGQKSIPYQLLLPPGDQYYISFDYSDY